jgi:hypothetical protein
MSWAVSRQCPGRFSAACVEYNYGRTVNVPEVDRRNFDETRGFRGGMVAKW